MGNLNSKGGAEKVHTVSDKDNEFSRNETCLWLAFLTHECNALRGLLLNAKKKREAVPSHAPGRPRPVPPLRSHALLTPEGNGRTHHCVKTPDYENAMERTKHLAQGWQICAQKLRTVRK